MKSFCSGATTGPSISRSVSRQGSAFFLASAAARAAAEPLPELPRGLLE